MKKLIMHSMLSVLVRTLSALLIICIYFPGKISSETNESCYYAENIIMQDKKEESKNVFQYYFESKGFKTGKIIIPELNLEVTLKENQFYKRENNVTDIYERINELREQFGLSTPYHDYRHGYGWSGIFEIKYSNEKAYGYIVLINKNLNKASMIYTKAHENGHFLWYIGKQERIYQKFQKPDFVKSKIQTDEDFGNLCGWIALKISGYNLDECFIINKENPEKENKLIHLRNLVKSYFLY